MIPINDLEKEMFNQLLVFLRSSFNGAGIDQLSSKFNEKRSDDKNFEKFLKDLINKLTTPMTKDTYILSLLHILKRDKKEMSQEEWDIINNLETYSSNLINQIGIYLQINNDTSDQRLLIQTRNNLNITFKEFVKNLELLIWKLD